MMVGDTRKIIDRRFREAAKEYEIRLLESHSWFADGDPRDAFSILLAYFMSGNDGFHPIETHKGNWNNRARPAWGTVLGCHVLVGQITVDFLFEARCDAFERTLAVVLDDDRPNERIAKKQNMDATLLALNATVLRINPAEVKKNPESNANAIMSRLSDLLHETMEDAGMLQPSPRPKEPS